MKIVPIVSSLLSVFWVAARSQAPAAKPADDARDAVLVSYDKFEDRTSITAEIKPAKIALPDGSSNLARSPLTARFECPGQNTRCSPSLVFLSHSGGAGYTYCNAAPVTFIADGKRIQASDCELVGVRIVFFTMPAADFLALAKAEHAEAKIGVAFVWTFDGEGLAAIRALAAHIEAKPQPQPEVH